MKKIILKFTLIALLVIASLAFILLFTERGSFILDLIEKVTLGAIIFASIYGIDKLSEKYLTLK